MLSVMLESRLRRAALKQKSSLYRSGAGTAQLGLAGGENIEEAAIPGPFTYYEFFAGGGMVRAGLASNWRCVYANEFDPLKGTVYSINWGNDFLKLQDIHEVAAQDLPGRVDLAWASFPCQDLSCAGIGLGLGDERGRLKTRSGTFWPFVGLMADLKRRGRAPKIIVIENVVGLLTTNSGSAFRSVASCLAKLDYRFGAIVIDARWFVPQSRPRVFVIAIADEVVTPPAMAASSPRVPWHPEVIIRSWRELPSSVSRRWIWFDPGPAPMLRNTLGDVVSYHPRGVSWHTKAETRRLISMMSKINRLKLREAQQTGRRMVASLFLRMRPAKARNRQCAEISFADISGCIRTPKGGGSRPRILVVHGKRVKSRLLSPKEAAKLMGLRSSYKLPPQYEAAFRVLGDGVVVPAVAFLRSRLLEPLLQSSKKPSRGRRRPSRCRWVTFRAGGHRAVVRHANKRICR
jgi:DNA (cytosine-5)-methyltransferase 1